MEEDVHVPKMDKAILSLLFGALLIGFRASAADAEFHPAYNMLQGQWSATSQNPPPYGVEIQGRKFRVSDSAQCEWLPFHVLSDVNVTPNGTNTFRRITIGIPHIGAHKHACFRFPVLQWSFPIPPGKAPDGHDVLWGMVDFYTSRGSWESHDSPPSGQNYSHIGAWPEISILPKSLESLRAEFRIAHSVRDVPMPEILLDRASVMAFVGQLVASGVPEHVRMDREGEFRELAGARN
jgi:hypothetical protein